MQGYAAALLSLLVAYRDHDMALASEVDHAWCDRWTDDLDPFVPVVAGSRCSLGKGMLRDPPIMLFGSNPPNSADIPSSPIQLNDSTGPDVDQLAADERQAQWERHVDEARAEEEAQSCLLEQRREEARLAALLDDEVTEVADSSPKRRRVLVVELSSGSSDRPRLSRCLRVPLDTEGVATLRMRCWRDDDIDEDEIPTPILDTAERRVAPPTEAAPVGELTPGLSTARDHVAEAEVEPDVIALGFEQYQQAYAAWVAGDMTSTAVVQRYGRHVLGLIEGQWALSAEDSLLTAERVQQLTPVPDTAVDTDSLHLAAMEDSQLGVATVVSVLSCRIRTKTREGALLAVGMLRYDEGITEGEGFLGA